MDDRDVLSAHSLALALGLSLGSASRGLQTRGRVAACFYTPRFDATPSRRRGQIGSWALAASLMLAACGNDSSGPSGPRNDKVAGHWQYVSGPMVVGAAVDNLSYLELTASGAGTLYTNSPKRARDQRLRSD